jgi:hypothetical protein
MVRAGVEVLSDLLARFEPGWANLTAAAAFDRMAGEVPAFAGLQFGRLPATGVELPVPGAGPQSQGPGAPAPITASTPEERVSG